MVESGNVFALTVLIQIIDNMMRRSCYTFLYVRRHEGIAIYLYLLPVLWLKISAKGHKHSFLVVDVCLRRDVTCTLKRVKIAKVRF